MLKKVLFGLTLVSFVGAASAQGLLNKRVTRFNKVKSELKVNAKSLDRGTSAEGLRTVKVEDKKSVPTTMRRAASSKTTWFRYDYRNEEDKSYVLSSAKLAQLVLSKYGGVATDNHNLLVLVPSTYANAVIDSVCNIFYETKNMTNCRVWIHNLALNSEGKVTIPTDASEADYSMMVNEGDIKGYTNHLQTSVFKLDKPFTVGQYGCFLGFQFTAPADSSCLVFGGEAVSGGWYEQFNFPTEEDETKTEPEWCNMYNLGNLPIGAHMDLTNCPTNLLEVDEVIETALKANEEGSVGVSVTNDAYFGVESLSYILSIDGTAQAEESLTPGKYYDYLVEGGSTGTIYVPCKVSEGEHTVTVKITKVNGQANGASTTEASAAVLGLDNPAERVAVVEEGTSTGCQNCPRGHVGLEKCKAALGDKVITLASHIDYYYVDPMSCSDYESFHDFLISGYPEAIINRVQSVDPYFGIIGIGDNYVLDSLGNIVSVKYGLDAAVTAINQVFPSEGSVTLSATMSEDKKLDVKTTTTFNVEREKAPYSLLFVLTEDGMSGKDKYEYNSEGYIDYTSTLWSQINGYSLNTTAGKENASVYPEDDLAAYRNGGQLFTQTYDNVIVKAWGFNGTIKYGSQSYDACPLYGINAFETLSGGIVEGEPIEYDTTLDISNNALIQNYSNLKLAVLLLNDNNGQIVNAAQVKLIDPTGINSAVKDNANSNVVARYSIDGRKLDAPVKGLNIVKMADGSSKKVLVK